MDKTESKYQIIQTRIVRDKTVSKYMYSTNEDNESQDKRAKDRV